MNPNKEEALERIDGREREDERLLSLFLRLKNGEKDAFDAFYNGSKRRVYYNILSLLGDPNASEDILQETYVRFLEKLSELDERNSPLGFLMVTSRNLALDYLRLSKRVTLYEESLPLEVGKETEDHLSSLDEERLLKRIQSLLKPKEFEILIKHVYLDLTFKEIASLLHRPLGTVLWSYNNAIKKLRKELQNETSR